MSLYLFFTARKKKPAGLDGPAGVVILL